MTKQSKVKCSKAFSKINTQAFTFKINKCRETDDRLQWQAVQFTLSPSVVLHLNQSTPILLCTDAV